MIARESLQEIGYIVKPHGIKGEMTAVTDYADCMGSVISHVFIDIEGLYVPFRIAGVRVRGAESVLLTLAGVKDEKEASAFSSKTLYALKADLPQDDDEGDEAEFYLEDLIGFTATDSGERLGIVSGYDDSTDNVLITIRKDDGRDILVPAVDDFITCIDTDKKILELELPEGLLALF